MVAGCVASAKANKVNDAYMNANAGKPITWLKNSQQILVTQLPADRKALLSDAENLPLGPTISTSDGKVSQNRTYPDLLKNPKDEANFETLMESEIYKVSLDGKSVKLKDKALYSNISVSPDGNYLLISTIHKPFSYIVPLSRFSVTMDVTDLDGKLVKTVNETPLIESMPKGFSSTRTGKRSMYWRSDEPASLVYVEALDGGDANQEAEYRDELFTWNAPFTDAPISFFKTKLRYAGLQFTNASYVLISETWYDTRSLKTYLLNLKTNESQLIDDRNSQDVYQDPGDFNVTKNQYGRSVVDVQKQKAYLLGEGFSANGAHPFIDEVDLKLFKKKRIYISNLKNVAEHLSDIIDIKKGEVLILQESLRDFPNYFIKNIKTGNTKAITTFENPSKVLKMYTKN